MIKELLRKILTGDSLTLDEASDLMDKIMTGEATPAQIAALLIALKQKGETAEEVAGFVKSMRRHATKVEIKDSDAVDGVGTGGDGVHSFNISTAAGIVSSAAGLTVAKHGNRSVSSKCGSADLLEATGANIDPGPEQVKESIDNIGFGFMFAPRFHPAMKYAIGPRRELGVRTVFNILGPMTNPAGVKRFVLGVYDKSLIHLVAGVLKLSGTTHALVVHSRDGMDELSISAPTDYLELKEGEIKTGVIDPETVPLKRFSSGAVTGGDAKENLGILNEVLSGSSSAYRDVVLLNAGAMIYIGGKAESIREGVALAAKAIDSGVAADRLKQWIEFTNKV